MAKQKTLQLYRSNEIYATKLLAQWMTIGYIDLYTAEHVNMDAEPIVARYYDNLTDLNGDVKLEWVKFTPTISAAVFATHLANNGVDVPTGVTPPEDPDWKTTPLFLDTQDQWYRLAWTDGFESEIQDIDTHISSTFGVFYDNEGSSDRIKTIEWFDNAKEINEVLDDLDYDDKTGSDNGDHQVVSEVDQLDGQISTRHATLIVDPSLALTETGSYGSDNRKLEHKVRIQPNVASGSEIYEYVEHTQIENVEYTDAASLPTATSGSTTYIHNTTDGKYYYKRSIINQILFTDANGLNAEVYIKRVTPEDADANNVREQYALFGADGNRISNSSDIKIYKDNALVKVYLGHVEDTLVGAWSDGNTTVYTNQGTTIEPTAQGETTTVYSDASCSTTLGQGTIEVEETSTHGSRIILTYNNTVYTISEADITHKPSTGTLTDALCFIYRQADDTYTLLAIDVEDFLSENEFGDGLQVSEPTRYYENMGSYSQQPDYPGTAATTDWVDGTNWFEDYDEDAQQAFAALTEPYILIGTGSGTDAYVIYQLSGDGKGKVVSVKITNGIRNNYLQVDATGINTKMFDITSTDANSTGLIDGRQLKNYLNIGNLAEETPSVMTGITDENGQLEKVTRTLHVNGRQLVVGTTQSGTDNDTLTVTIYEQDVNIADGSTSIEGVTDINNLITKSFEDPTESGTTRTTPYVEYNGVIYHWNGSAYEPFEIGNDTNGAVAFAILNYMAYTLDMGKYDTPVTYE